MYNSGKSCICEKFFHGANAAEIALHGPPISAISNPHTSMNAIFLCAGQGNRFKPSSFLRPKPLTPINGVPNVERTVSLLKKQGFERITMVVGYLAEQFDYLQEQYGVELVFNPAFAETNSNSSLALVGDRLDGAFLLDGDIHFSRNIFASVDASRSQFVVQPTPRGLEWEVLTDADNRIYGVNKWTSAGYSMCSCSYWTGEGARLLVEALKDSAPDHYWEESALRIFAKTPIYAHKEPTPFALEMDSLMDAVHLELLSHEEVAALCSYNFEPVKLKGLTNSSWLTHDHEGVARCLRIPGFGTEKYINRSEEERLIPLIGGMNITPETHFYADGVKTTRFMQDHRISTAADANPEFFSSLAHVLQRLHSITFREEYGLPGVRIADQFDKFRKLFLEKGGQPLPASVHDDLVDLAGVFDAEDRVFCHRDLAWENILIKDAKGTDLLLIDFEYAGFAHYLWEYASFILEAGMNGATRDLFATICGIVSPEERTRLRQMEMLVDYTWGMWGFVQGYMDYSLIKFKRLKKHHAEYTGRE